MDNLDTILKRVGELKADLNAMKTHSEEREVCEEVIDSRYSWGSTPITECYTESVEIDDGPDTQKREAAKAGLEQLYSSSDWYAARYEAGMALGMQGDRLKDELKGWKAVLERDFTLPKNKENMQKIIKAKMDMKGLGYSSMGLFAVRHPIAATVAAATAVYGAGYVLVQYVCR